MGNFDRKEQLKELSEKIENGVKQIFSGEDYKKYLAVVGKFHNYSINNSILILLQKPDASYVAGFNTWKKMNRFVKKGEKGIRILAPCPIKTKNEDDEDETIMLFKVTTVFDISQTEGEPLPSLGVDELTETVEDYDKLKNALIASCPVMVVEEDISSGAKGYFSATEKKIVIKKGVSQLQFIKTLIHECAHSIMHDRKDVIVSGAEKSCRSEKEIQAESVAYTVCSYFGLDTSEYSFSYIASWAEGKELKDLKNSMEVIQKAAAYIIDKAEAYLLCQTRTPNVEDNSFAV